MRTSEGGGDIACGYYLRGAYMAEVKNELRISTAFKQTDTPIRVRNEPRKQRRVCVYVQIIQWGLKLMLRDVRVVQAPGKRTKTIHCSGNVHGEPGETRATKTGNGGDDARGRRGGHATDWRRQGHHEQAEDVPAA